MKRLTEYSESETIQIPMNQTIVSQPYMKNASSLKACDVSGAGTAAATAFSNFADELDQIWVQISGHLDTVADTWGTSFISVDGNPLEIINKEKYKEYYDKMTKAIDKLRKKAKSFCDELDSGTGVVNGIIDSLQKNYTLYNEYKSYYEKAKEDGDYDIAQSWESSMLNMSEITEDMLDGQWVVGGN